MITLARIFTFVCTLLCVVNAQVQAAGSLKVLETAGDVIVSNNLTGEIDLLLEGMMLSDQMTIVTGAKSFASLVLSNGSRLMLSAESKLNVRSLQQAPFDNSKTFEELDADPSNSQSMFYLTYGNVLADVRKLQPGSSFNIETPVGRANVLGTVMSVSVVRNGDQVTMTVRNADGTVEVFAKTATGDFLNLPEGEKVVVKLDDVDSSAPKITVETPVALSGSEVRSMVKAIGKTLREAIALEDSPIMPGELQQDGVDRSQLLDIQHLTDALERGLEIPDELKVIVTSPEN